MFDVIMTHTKCVTEAVNIIHSEECEGWWSEHWWLKPRALDVIPSSIVAIAMRGVIQNPYTELDSELSALMNH